MSGSKPSGTGDGRCRASVSWSAEAVRLVPEFQRPSSSLFAHFHLGSITMLNRTRTAACFAILAACAFLSGCGGEDGPTFYPVRGTITLDDQPLPNASIIFQPTSGPVATGTSDAEGKFTLTTSGQEGAAAGDYTISVTAVEGSNANANMSPDDMANMTDAGTLPSEPKSLIPAKYALAGQSGLTATVSDDASKNDVTLKLTSK